MDSHTRRLLRVLKLLLQLLEENVQSEILRRQRSSMRLLRDSCNPFDTLSDRQFRRNFRFPKRIVRKLVDTLHPFYEDHNSMISFEVKVLVALKFFACGSYQNTIGCHGALNLSQSSVCRAIEKVSHLIVRHMHSYICFPKTLAEVDVVASGFRRKFGLENVAGCIDCTHIAIVAPPYTDVEHQPRHYRNRKRFYSINVEAICDANLRFLSVNAKFPGACHDSGIWQMSRARSAMRELQTVRQCWLLGDSGYPLEPWLLTPYRATTAEHEELFNQRHISSRNTIERAFGVLKAKFRCLLKHRTLHYHPTKAGSIINSCFILYNFLLDEGAMNDDDEDNNEDGSFAESMEMEHDNPAHEDVIDDMNFSAAPVDGDLLMRAREMRDDYARSLLNAEH